MSFPDKRALIVDDDPSIAAVVAAVLKDLQLKEVIVETDPEKACGLFELGSEKFDLVVIDLMMPKMDGIDFLKTVRFKSQHATFVMLTAKDTEDDFHKAKAAGAAYYFMKPLDPMGLRIRLDSILRE